MDCSFCRWFQRAADTYVKVPFLGPISYLTLAVSPFCIVFAVLWAVYRVHSFAWIGQDVLGIALIITVLQIVHVPNLKVGTVLLSCAFLYDIFWVFVSKKLFHESVMIVVSNQPISHPPFCIKILTMLKLKSPLEIFITSHMFKKMQRCFFLLCR